MQTRKKILAWVLTFMLVVTSLPVSSAFAASPNIDTDQSNKTNITEDKDVIETDVRENKDVIETDVAENKDVIETDVVENKDANKSDVVENKDVNKSDVVENKNLNKTKATNNENARYGYGIYGLYYKRISLNKVYVYWDSTDSSYYDVTIRDNDTYEKVAYFSTSVPNFEKWLPAGSYNVEIEDEDYNFNDIDIYVPGMVVKNLRANAKSSTSIKLSWDKVDGADGYQIWKYNRRTKQYFLKTSVGQATNSYIDRGLSRNNTYKYKVRAFSYSNGDKTFGKFSNVASDITGSKTPSFTNRKAYTTSIYLKWSKVNNAKGYNIYRSTSYNGPYRKVATLKNSNTTSYTNKNLSKGTTYYYKIQSYRYINNQIYRSNLSAAKKITTFAHGRPNLVGYAPSEDSFDSYITNYYGIGVENNSGYTMYVQADAFLEDADYYSYDRNLKVYGWSYRNGNHIYRSKKVKIPPHSTRYIFFYTSDASWYDDYTTILCKFKLDGAYYNLRVGYDYGWAWWRL